MNDYNEELIIAQSFCGAPHFKVELTYDSDTRTVHIRCPEGTAAAENQLLLRQLNIRYLSGETKTFLDINNIIFVLKDDEGADLYFDGFKLGSFNKDGKLENREEVSLSNCRSIGSLAVPVTAQNVEEYERHRDGGIDSHTHFIAAFPMGATFDLVISNKKSITIPILVVLQILKQLEILNEGNQTDWFDFLEEGVGVNEVNDKTSRQEGKEGQNLNVKELLEEDFKEFTRTLTELEKNLCFLGSGNPRCICLEKLKQRLDRSWGTFCNGFDLPATHHCDFTEHMEAAYNLRNWFGKDPFYMREQLEIIYQEYERNSTSYAELPAGGFKKPEVLNKFVDITRAIEAQRKLEGKSIITLRPALSISRLVNPTVFRESLFAMIPIILQSPALAGINVLAHEVNPTTEHLHAIQEFAGIINNFRPGFVIELHAGETEFFGEINLYEAWRIAQSNPNLYIRAGHATYGDHKAERLPNFIHEKCTHSNMALIDIEPEVAIQVYLGIAEGRSNIFWGSDGVIYNPNYSPGEQANAFLKLIKREDNELELRKVCQTIAPEMSFEVFKRDMNQKFRAALRTNELLEFEYIGSKTFEMELYQLKKNAENLRGLLEKDEEINQETREEITELYKEIGSVIPDQISLEFLKSNSNNTEKLEQLKRLNGSSSALMRTIKTPSELEIFSRTVFEEKKPDFLKHRDTILYCNQFYKGCDESSRSSLDAFLADFQKSGDIRTQIPHFLPQLEAFVRTQELRVAGLAPAQSDGHPFFELFLDPNYLFHKKMQELKRENESFLLANSVPIELVQNGLVLFGKPELMDYTEHQNEYLIKLLKNIHWQLFKNSSKVVYLFGGIDEGINPLVYEILKIDPALNTKIQHIVAADESFMSVCKSKHPEHFSSFDNDFVSYGVLANTKRAEAHKAYANFIQEKNLRNTLMFGGGLKAGTWNDMRAILTADGRKKIPVKFYNDGCARKTSSGYARSVNPDQVFNPREGETFYEDNPQFIEQLKSVKTDLTNIASNTQAYIQNISFIAMQISQILPISNEHLISLFTTSDQVSPYANEETKKIFVSSLEGLDKTQKERIIKFIHSYGGRSTLMKMQLISGIELRSLLYEECMLKCEVKGQSRGPSP